MIELNNKTHATLNIRKIPEQYLDAMEDVLEESAGYWLEQLRKRLPPGAPNFPNYQTNGRQSTGRLRDSFHVGPIHRLGTERRIELVYPDNEQLAMEIVVHERGKDIFPRHDRVSKTLSSTGKPLAPAMRFTIEGHTIVTRKVHIRAKWFILSSRGAAASHFYAKMRARIRKINSTV